MKIEMVTREMENMMSDYIVAIFPKNDYREGVFYEAVEVMYQFTEDICECEWLIKLNPGKFIDIPEDFIDDTINKMNFHYRIMKKYKIDRKEQKNSIVYRMEGHNFYRTREELMKQGFKLIDSYYNDDNGRVSGCLLEKNDNIVGISIPGLAPHPSMDDIIIAFNQNLFHEIGRIFPQLWMAHSYDDPMNIKAFFRYSDLYNVE